MFWFLDCRSSVMHPVHLALIFLSFIMQLEDKYKEYKLNFYRGENKDFPSKLLRDIIEVSFRFLVWYCFLNCLLILTFFCYCRQILLMVQRRKKLQTRGLLSLLWAYSSRIRVGEKAMLILLPSPFSRSILLWKNFSVMGFRLPYISKLNRSALKKHKVFTLFHSPS